MADQAAIGPAESAGPAGPAGSAGAADSADSLGGARRRLSPRPVPVGRRRRAQAATDEERTPAEEMDDVGTQDDKGEPAATKTARPKTAAEIVAEQRAREQAASEAASEAPSEASSGPSSEASSGAASGAAKPAGADQPASDKPASDQPAAGKPAAGGKPGAGASGASGNKPPVVKKPAPVSAGKGKQALSSVGSGVRKLRNLIASLVWLIAVLAAAVLALGALFTALDQTNQSNEIVRWILERGHDLVGPFKDLFRLETAKNTLLVNWGIAALVYLIAGKIVEKIIRP